MQKQIAMCLMASMLTMVFGPAITTAETASSTISTTFTAGLSGSGNMEPVIKAVWETPDDYTLTEDTQIDPPGDCDEQKTVTICSIFEDDSLNDTMTPEDIAAVLNGKAWLYYDSRPDQTEDYDLRVNEADDPIALSALTKDDGIELFCGDEDTEGIGERNPGITTYYDGYDYEDVCGSYGQLRKGTAFVFCGDFDLSYESAAGEYEVQVKATDAFGANVYTPDDTDWFTYVPLVAYEVDFSALDYGNVAMNAWDIDPDGNNIGDEVWGIDEDDVYRPTVRNVGNVELKMQVEQDDMGFDNIHYKARVGSAVPSWKLYEPYELVTLEETVPLSTMLEMDFGILVDDFIQGGELYGGDMMLDAIEDPFDPGQPESIHLEWHCPGCVI